MSKLGVNFTDDELNEMVLEADIGNLKKKIIQPSGSAMVNFFFIKTTNYFYGHLVVERCKII